MVKSKSKLFSVSGWLKKEFKKPENALLSELSLVVLQRHAQHPFACGHWGRREKKEAGELCPPGPSASVSVVNLWAI